MYAFLRVVAVSPYRPRRFASASPGYVMAAVLNPRSWHTCYYTGSGTSMRQRRNLGMRPARTKNFRRRRPRPSSLGPQLLPDERLGVRQAGLAALRLVHGKERDDLADRTRQIGSGCARRCCSRHSSGLEESYSYTGARHPARRRPGSLPQFSALSFGPGPWSNQAEHSG